MTTLACVDLDRTLIYSVSALGASREPHPLRCVEVLNGRPSSFLTSLSWELLEKLAATAVLVPTTTRTPEQIARVEFPRAPSGPSYAIAANGGVVLVDGQADSAWADRVRRATAGGPEPTAVARWIADRPDPSIKTISVAAGLFVYVVGRSSPPPSSWVGALAAWCSDRGWTVSVQGRKVYALPRALTKLAAAEEIARRTGSRRLLAAGDSLLDRDLLDAADASIRPRLGELADVGWGPPHVQVTSAGGVLAGEEIAAWLLAQAARSDAHHPSEPEPDAPLPGSW